MDVVNSCVNGITDVSVAILFIATCWCGVVWSSAPLIGVDRPGLRDAIAVLVHSWRLIVAGGAFAALSILWASHVTADAAATWQTTVYAVFGHVPPPLLHVRLQAQWYCQLAYGALLGPVALILGLTAIVDAVCFLSGFVSPLVELAQRLLGRRASY